MRQIVVAILAGNSERRHYLEEILDAVGRSGLQDYDVLVFANYDVGKLPKPKGGELYIIGRDEVIKAVRRIDPRAAELLLPPGHGNDTNLLFLALALYGYGSSIILKLDDDTIPDKGWPNSHLNYIFSAKATSGYYEGMPPNTSYAGIVKMLINWKLKLREFLNNPVLPAFQDDRVFPMAYILGGNCALNGIPEYPTLSNPPGTLIRGEDSYLGNIIFLSGRVIYRVPAVVFHKPRRRDQTILEQIIYWTEVGKLITLYLRSGNHEGALSHVASCIDEAMDEAKKAKIWHPDKKGLDIMIAFAEELKEYLAGKSPYSSLTTEEIIKETARRTSELQERWKGLLSELMR